jgi:hypothetical protein
MADIDVGEVFEYLTSLPPSAAASSPPRWHKLLMHTFYAVELSILITVCTIFGSNVSEMAANVIKYSVAQLLGISYVSLALIVIVVLIRRWSAGTTTTMAVRGTLTALPPARVWAAMSCVFLYYALCAIQSWFVPPVSVLTISVWEFIGAYSLLSCAWLTFYLIRVEKIASRASLLLGLIAGIAIVAIETTYMRFTTPH